MDLLRKKQEHTPSEILAKIRSEDMYLLTDMDKVKMQLKDISIWIKAIVTDITTQMTMQKMGGTPLTFDSQRKRLIGELGKERKCILTIITQYEERKARLIYLRNDYRRLTKREIADDTAIPPAYLDSVIDTLTIFIKILRQNVDKNESQQKFCRGSAFKRMVEKFKSWTWKKSTPNPYPEKFAEKFYEYQIDHYNKREIEKLQRKVFEKQLRLIELIEKLAKKQGIEIENTSNDLKVVEKGKLKRVWEAFVASKKPVYKAAQGTGVVFTATGFMLNAFPPDFIAKSVLGLISVHAYQNKDIFIGGFLRNRK